MVVISVFCVNVVSFECIKVCDFLWLCKICIVSLFSPTVINQLLVPISCFVMEVPFYLHKTCKSADVVFLLH